MTSSRPTVVLLHGVGLDHTVWDDVVPLLAASYDVVTPDLPGHGSGPRVPEGVDLAGLAELTAASVPDGAHLVGFSLGSLVAQHLAATRPGSVRSLASVSSVCRRTPAEREAVLRRLATAERELDDSVSASLARWFDGTTVSPAVVAHTREVLLANDREQYLQCYRVFATGDAEVAPLLGSVTVPALAVTGSDDPGSTPEMTARLGEALPDCRTVVVDGARHMLPVQEPALLTHHLDQLIGGRVHA